MRWKNKKILWGLIPIIVALYVIPNASARLYAMKTSKENASVATFKITEEGTLTQDISALISPSDMETKSLMIINDSEVTVDYTINIIKETNNITQLTAVLTDVDGNEVAATGQLSPKGSNELSLQISWPQSTGDIDTNLEYIGMVDKYKIEVSARQTD